MLFLRYYFWVVPHLVLVVVLAGSIRRGLHRQLQIFSVFAGFELLQFLTLLVLSRLPLPFSGNIYHWALVFGLGVGTCLELGVIYALANELVLTRIALAGVLRPLLRWTLVGLLLVAAVASGTLSGISIQRAMNIFQVLDFSSGLIKAGMLVVLLAFSRTLQISWRSWPTGVALGFGISACIELAAAALRSSLGRSSFIAVDIAQMAAFHVSVVVWLVYLCLPERRPTSAGTGFRESDIQLWNQELQRITGR